jgi:hypothetical protein
VIKKTDQERERERGREREREREREGDREREREMVRWTKQETYRQIDMCVCVS